jgi:hypothetical protein
MLQLLYSQGESPWYLLNMRLGGPQVRNGDKEKNFWPCQESKPNFPSCSQSLFLLSYSGSTLEYEEIKIKVKFNSKGLNMHIRVSYIKYIF